MAVYIEQQTARAAGWSRATAWFSAVLFITAAISHRFGLVETPAFIAVLGLAAVLAIVALLLAAISFRRVWYRGDIGGADLAKGMFLALVVLVPFAITGYRSFVSPNLSDISTDTAAPPPFVKAAVGRTPAMNVIAPIGEAAAKLQAETYPEVTGRRYNIPAERALATVLALVKKRGWHTYEMPQDASSNPEVTVEARARTLLLAFPSDVAIRVTDEGNTAYVDMRSASRFGRNDLGDNAARIVAFLDDLDTEIALQAGTAPVE